MEQAFPLHFCILQAIKNWTAGRPGNEANLILHLARNGCTRGTIPDSYTTLGDRCWIFYAPTSITITLFCPSLSLHKMSTSDVSPPRQKGDISKGEMENQAGGQPTAVPDPSHTELTKDEFVTKTSSNQPTETESLCDAQLNKEEATIPKFTACEEKRLSSRDVEGPPKDKDGAQRRGDRLTDAGVLTADCEDDLDYDELMESESYDRSTQHQVRGDGGGGKGEGREREGEGKEWGRGRGRRELLNVKITPVYPVQTRDFVDEEDEVKVHVTEDIEEGEISSDEEGEIKGRHFNQL